MKCHFCKIRKATLLCDFRLGVEIGGWSPCDVGTAQKVGRLHELVQGKGLPHARCYSDHPSEIFTCDAPMCGKCAKNIGTTFFCGETGGVETKDFCPIHASEKEGGMKLITAGDAEMMRLKLWKMKIADGKRVLTKFEKIMLAAEQLSPEERKALRSMLEDDA